MDSIFVYYADYFAWLAQSGLQSAQALYRAIAVIKAVNQTTFTNFTNAVNSQGELKFTLRSAYEQIYSNMLSTDPLQGPFTVLSEYIKEKSGLSVDEYLTEQGLKVIPTYAAISALFNEPISPENVEEK